jgi:aspartate/methionine/tyrosine aminotransferase
VPGFLDGEPLAPNALEAARLELADRGETIIDLTQSNPTVCGLLLEPRLISEPAAEYAAGRCYEPDSKGSVLLRQEICRYYARRSPPLSISPEHIVVTAGTSEAYSHLLTLLCDQGDAVYVPAPGYPLLDLIAAAHRTALVPYRGDALPAAADARAIAAVSPGNPTGAVLRSIPRSFAASALPLICDEVFSEFSVSGEPVPPLAALGAEQPVFLLNGISKMFLCPDLKLGWIVMNDEALAAYGERLAVLNDSYLNASYLVQHIAASLFRNGMDAAAGQRREIRERVTSAFSLLSSIPACRPLMPEAGAFLFVRYDKPIDDEEFALALLNEERVLVHPGYFYAADEPAFVISCVPEPHLLREGIARIQKFLTRR